MNDYPIVVSWSAEDEAFIADVYDIEHCSAWGETPEEALREVRLALSDILDDAEERGTVLPPPSTQPLRRAAS